MNFLEAYKAYKCGEDVERPALYDSHKVKFSTVFEGLSGNDIEATNWKIKRKPMKCWEAIRRMLEEDKTVANDVRPGSRYTRKHSMYLYHEEISTNTWYIVSENENENENEKKEKIK